MKCYKCIYEIVNLFSRLLLIILTIRLMLLKFEDCLIDNDKEIIVFCCVDGKLCSYFVLDNSVLDHSAAIFTFQFIFRCQCADLSSA